MYQVQSPADGVRAILDDDLPLQSFTVAVLLPVSTRDDPDDQIGTSHLLEHLVMSVPAGPTGEPVSDWVSGVGGDSNASTRHESLTYWARVPAESAVECVDRLLTAVATPVFTDDLVTAERAVVIQELLAAGADAQDRSSERFCAELFAGHPLGRPVGGSLDFPAVTAAAMTLAHRRSLGSRAACVSLVGRPDLLEAAAEVVARYPLSAPDGMTVAPRRAPDRVRSGPLDSATTTATTDATGTDAEYAYLTVGGLGANRRHPDWAAFEVLAALVGGVPGSLLYSRLRGELGLSYQLYSITTSFSDCGMWRIIAGAEPDRVTELEAAIRGCLTEIAAGDVAPAALAAARAQTMGSTLIENEDPVARAHGNAAFLVETGLIEPPADWARRHLGSVGAEDVARAARGVLDSYVTAVCW
jgi:predicted Zn-dependent peptidase